MSAIMLKMAADFIGISPDEIKATFEHLQEVAIKGVGQIEEMNNRLSAIENALEIKGEENVGAITDASTDA